MIDSYKEYEKGAMDMPISWRKAYVKLTDFIAGHSEVKIGANRVDLPKSVRPEFWQLFNATRIAFLEEKCTDLTGEARLLSQNYIETEQEITKLLDLDDISMMPSLGRFVHGPTDEIVRVLRDPLFNLLKKKEGIETFMQASLRDINVAFRSLYQLGYEKWVALSLIKLLEVDKLFKVTLRELPVRESTIIASGSDPEPVPLPRESRSLSFEYNPNPALIVPDFIVHSTEVNRYIALRSQIGRAYAKATELSNKREWYSIDSAVALETGSILVYMADQPEEISLVADVKKIHKPDLILECRGQKDWFDEDGIKRVKFHYNSLKPRLGTYVVSRETVPKQAYRKLKLSQASKGMNSKQGFGRKKEPDKQKMDIHILNVGFDSSKLAPIIDAGKSIISYNNQ